ncbi:MAG: FtsX-like permease family protein [Cyclobacteriaceae bacterium]|nr:FtsX-like permease family protein [Cyclobacteriaceae bacterium]
MRFPFFVARRYFFTRKKKNFIHFISILSVAGVAISTAALIIVLSVFNGLADLFHSLYNSFDPPLKVEALRGKTFGILAPRLDSIRNLEGVAYVTETLEDYAYVKYREASMVVTIKGMSDNFSDQHRIDDRIVEGTPKLRDGDIRFALLGKGVQHILSVSTEETQYALQIHYIRDVKTYSMDPSSMYSHKSIRPGGVFSIEKGIDENYIFVPLDFARELLNVPDRLSALEIKLTEDADIRKAQQQIQGIVGDQFAVLTNEEQHKDLYRLLRFEKLFTFLALSLLILVASINIFFSLMMLALDKQKDISILCAMGAPRQVIRAIFIAEGAIIAFSGAMLGILAGAGLVWLQEHVGLVSMGIESSVVNNYPVHLLASDVALTLAVIVVITIIVSLRPSYLASRSYSLKEL